MINIWKNRIVFVGILLGTFLVSMNTTILSSVGPLFIEVLGNESLYPWIFISYLLTSTILIPVLGKLSDSYGRKKILFISLFIFMAGSIASTQANSMIQLVLLRGVMGVGAGGIIPISLVVVNDLLTIEKRVKFQGYLNLIWGVSAVTGPVVGSLLVSYFHWSSIFYFNTIITVIALVSLLFYIEEIELKKKPLGIKSAMSFSLLITLLLLLFNFTNKAGLIIPVLVISVVVYVFVEKTAKSKFIPTALYSDKRMLFYNLNTFLFFFAIFGLESYIPYFLQTAQNYSILVSGLVLSGISIGWYAVSFPMKILIKKYSFTQNIILGNLFLFLPSILFLFYTEETSIWIMFFILFCHGMGFGAIQITANIACYELAPDGNKGLSSSMLSFSRNIGTTVSLAYMGTLVMSNPFYILYAALILSGVSFVITFMLSKRLT